MSDETGNGTNGRSERLARLESGMAGLTSMVTSLAAKVDQLADSRKTPWNTLASWAGVILVIGGFGSSVIHRALTDKISGVQSQVADSEKLSETRHDSQAEHIRLLNERLSVIRGEVDTVIAGLQRTETQLKNKSDLTNTAVEDLRNWVSEHHYAIHGRHLPPKVVWPVVGHDIGGHVR